MSTRLVLPTAPRTAWTRPALMPAVVMTAIPSQQTASLAMVGVVISSTINLFDTFSFLSSDVDECALSQDLCEQNCQNTVGSYTCSCRSGFILNNDQRACDGECGYTAQYLSVKMESCNLMLSFFVIAIDKDECASPDSNNCQQLCVNTPGSYVCQCNAGYQLNDDRSTCRGTLNILLLL